jgi:hypothetical protein
LQHPPLEFAQLQARVDPQLLDQRPPCVPVGPQRIGLPASAVEGDDEQLVEPLVQRHPLHQLRQLPDGVMVVAKTQEQVHPVAQGCAPQLLETRHVRPAEIEPGDVLECCASPPSECAVELGQRVDDRVSGTAALWGREPAYLGLEPVGVDRRRLDEERVATGTGLQGEDPLGATLPSVLRT